MALMTAQALNARSVYGNVGRSVGSDRDIEIQVFQASIAKLRSISGLDFKFTPDAAKILSDNLKLWDMLTVDLAQPDNQIDKNLAAQLIGLSKFVRVHTMALYRGEGSVDVLVDINTAILKGLLGQPGNANAA